MIVSLLIFIIGLVAIGFGIRCMTLPLDAYTLIPTLMGIAMLAEGICCIGVWFRSRKEDAAWLLLVNGILSGILGVMLLCSDALQIGLAAVYATFVALWLLISGVIRIVEAFRQRSAGKKAAAFEATTPEERKARAVLREFSRQWGVSLTLGILMIVLGVFSLGHPFTTMITIGMYIGIDAVIIGVNLIFRAFAENN